MFFSPSAIVAFFFTLFLAGQVAAIPLPMPMAAAVERNLKRQTPPVQDAVKSDGTVITAYKRQTPDVQSPSKSDGGAVVAYKRQTPDVQTPSKSDGGAVVAYKRQTPDVQTPSKSDGGAILPYKRGAEVPSQVAARSVNGVIELY